MKKKILIIPSWYPTKSNPIAGSFFREQALLINDLYHIKILLGYPIHLSIKRYMKHILKRYFLNYNNMNADEPIVPPAVESFHYKQSRLFSFNTNFQLMMKSYSKKIEGLIKNDWKPDLLHAHCTVMGGIIAVELGEKFNIPVVITEHAGPFLLHKYSKKQQMHIKYALEHAITVAVVSNHQMRSILMHDIQCNPVIIGNFIDEKIFPLKKRQNHLSDNFNILIIGYPSYIKDIKTFFLALRHLLNKNFTQFSAIIIGGGIPGDLSVDDYHTYASDYDLKEYCTFVDFVERDKMREYYYRSNVVLSVSIAESFGVSIAEALACGIPVITTDSGGVRDIIDSSNGIIVNIKDYTTIAETIIKLHKGSINFNPLELRKSVIRKFGREAFKKKLLDLYKNTINKYNGI